MKKIFILGMVFIFFLTGTGNVFSREPAVQTLYFGCLNAPDTKLFKRAFALLTEALKRNGRGLIMKRLPGKRSLINVNKGLTDGDAFRVHDLNQDNAYPGIVRVDEPIFILDQSVWSKKNIKVDGWESLRPYSIVYHRGTKFIRDHESIFKSVQIVNEMQSVFTVLKIDRADLTITSRETGMLCLKKFSLEDSGIKVQYPPLLEIALHTYLHKSHAALAVELAGTLKQMKQDGTYNRLLNDVQ